MVLLPYENVRNTTRNDVAVNCRGSEILLMGCRYIWKPRRERRAGEAPAEINTPHRNTHLAKAAFIKEVQRPTSNYRIVGRPRGQTQQGLLGGCSSLANTPFTPQPPSHTPQKKGKQIRPITAPSDPGLDTHNTHTHTHTRSAA